MSPIRSRKHNYPRPLTHQSLTAASLLTSLALGAPYAAAQALAVPGPEPKAETLDGIEVEGEQVKRYGPNESANPKFTQPLVDTTQTINIISSELFTEQGAATLTDALRNSPGVGTFYVGENGNTTTGDAVYLRGFDTSGSIFVDGVRDLGSVSRDVFNIDQIEVAKGPAGTDNGRTAPTGAINLVTKQPYLRDSGSFSTSFGSDDQKRVTADWNHQIGSTNAFRFNLIGQNSGVPGRDHVENSRWGIAPSLGFGLGSSTRVYLNYLHVQQDNLPDGGVPTIGLPGYSSPDPERPEIGLAPRVNSDNFYGTLSDYDRVKVDMFTVIVEHDFSPATRLYNVSRWGRTDQDYLLTAYLSDTTRLLTPDISDPSTWTVLRALPTFKDQRNRILTNQTNLNTQIVGATVQHDLSIGLELTREELDSVALGALDDSSWPAANLYQPDPNVSGLVFGPTGASGQGQTDTTAIYAFDTIKLSPQWQVNAGVRFDRYDTDFSSTAVCGARGAPACGDLPPNSIVPNVDGHAADTLFNWKLGVLYKPTENGSVYANFAVAQQPPGGSSLELSSRPNNANNPIFDPQKAKTAEIGVKWNVLDDALLLTAAIYNTVITNEIVQDPVDLQYFQTGEKRVRGIEISAVGQISEAWSVSTGFTVMNAEVTSGPAVSTDGSSDLAYTPERAFTAWTTYELPAGLTIGGGVRYAGELKRGTDGAIGTPAKTDDYWVFDAVASYPVNKHLDLRLNLYNLFDEDYVAAINKSGYRYTPGLPRSGLISANVRF